MGICLTVLCFFFLPIYNAYAYLDPGSGSAIIQGIIAAIMGGSFVIKLYWRKIVSIFQKNPNKKIDN